MLTDKVVMWRRIAVKTVRSDSGGKLLNLADIGKQRKIPVNGSKADVRKFFPDIQIHGLRCRMIVSAAKEGLNRLSLSAVFKHLYHSKSILVIVTVINITEIEAAVNSFPS